MITNGSMNISLENGFGIIPPQNNRSKITILCVVLIGTAMDVLVAELALDDTPGDMFFLVFAEIRHPTPPTTDDIHGANLVMLFRRRRNHHFIALMAKACIVKNGIVLTEKLPVAVFTLEVQDIQCLHQNTIKFDAIVELFSFNAILAVVRMVGAKGLSTSTKEQTR